MVIINNPDKFNKYDEKILKRVQDLSFMILKDFIKVCDDNNIEYFLDGGTLIGAVRHEGFIPWDDDIDVIMLKDQHDKFIKVMEENPLEKYDFLCLNVKKDYWRAYSQLSLNETHTEVYYDYNADFDVGLTLDIFVLDNFPCKGFSRKLFTFKRKIYTKLLWIFEIVYNESYISKNKERIGKILAILFKIIRLNPKRMNKIANNLINSQPANSNCVCIISTLYPFRCIPKAWFSDYKIAKFESIEAKIPIGYDEYLTMVYGDYMKLPPEEDRVNHMYNNVDFGPYGIDE